MSNVENNNISTIFLAATKQLYEWYFYLPKFLILASMFVWRFVCLSVCLSVRNFFETGHSFLYIFTKLDPSEHLCRLTMPIVFLGQMSNN